MTEQPDSQLCSAFDRAVLPVAPETLRQRLHEITFDTSVSSTQVDGHRSIRRAITVLGVAAALIVAGAIISLPLGAPPIPTTAIPTATIPTTAIPTATIPETVDGLVVMTVSEALAAHAAGSLPDSRAAIRGFWSDGSVGHSCVPSREPVGELEMRCLDGEFGITERPEPIWVVDQFGHITYEAQGPHLTPWFSNDLDGLVNLFSLPFINGQRFLPVPIVVLGHFDDSRMEACRPEARQLCADRLVVERIVSFAIDSVPTPAVSPSPTPFPASPPPGLFDATTCAGNIDYAFVGWTTEAELGVDRGFSGHVWAAVTADVIQRTSGWNDDPNGSGHRFQVWARLICWAVETPYGGSGMNLESQPGSAYVLWDDGIKVPGQNPIRTTPVAS